MFRRVVGRDARPGAAAGAVAAREAVDRRRSSKGLKYRLVGPSRGGRVTTVTGVPSQPKTFYMGVASGGLFRTTDGGATWVPITDGKVPLGSTGAIAVADSDPNIIYLGTGSDGVRSNVSTGRGVYKSTDGGQTWKFAGLYNAGQIGAVRIHPTNPDIVWVAAGGDIFKPNAERGVFKTTDGGKTWRKVLFVSDSVGAMDVELQPGNPNVVYAWMSRLERKPWTIISGSREGGFYKSTDGGETLHEDHDRTAGRVDRQRQSRRHRRKARSHLRADRSQARRRFLSLGRCGTNVGARSTRRRSLIQRPFYYTTLGADPTNADVVYAGAEGFFKSTDGGKTFALAAHAARRQSRHLDQSERRQHHDPGERRRRERFVRRRPHVVDANEPTDRRDLRRLGRQPVSLQTLRRAAGQHDADHLEPGRPVRARRLAQRSRLRNWSDHAASARIRTSSTDRAKASTA